MPKPALKPAPAHKKTKPTGNASAPAKQRSSKTQSQAPRNLVKSTLPADLDLNLGSSTTLNLASETLDADLIPVTQGEIGGVKCLVVDARAMHSVTGSARGFANWITYKVEQFGFEEDVDFIKNKFIFNSGPGRKELVYTLSLDMAKELAMVENNDMGRKARRYFIDCERKLLSVQTSVGTPAPVQPLAKPPTTDTNPDVNNANISPPLLDHKGNPYEKNDATRHMLGLARLLTKKPRSAAYREYARSLAVTGSADEDLAQKMTEHAYRQGLRKQIGVFQAATDADCNVLRNLSVLMRVLEAEAASEKTV